MIRVLIIGAHSQIARVATRLFLEHEALCLRQAKRLGTLADHPRIRIVEGDALDVGQLKAVMPGHDVVYANLARAMGRLAKNIITAMEDSGVRRRICISSMGVHDEIPG